jgi:hypothetical protein
MQQKSLIALYQTYSTIMAEQQGFEPWQATNLCWFSRPVPSTAWVLLHDINLIKKLQYMQQF